MSITSGHLDSLLGLSVDPQALASLNYLSGSAANGAVTALSARTGNAPYAAAISLAVTRVDDASNTIVVTATINVNDPYGYGNGSSTTVPYNFTVIGQAGNDLLLAANNAAATQAVSQSAIASAVQSGASASLSNELFVLASDGAMIGTAVTLPQTVNFTPLSAPTETVAQAISTMPSTAVAIVDKAANVQSGLDGLQSLAAAGDLSSVTLTDGGTPTITLTAGQLSADATVLQDVGGNFALAVRTVLAGNAASVAAAAHVTSVAVQDSAAQISANLDGLQSLLTSGKLSGAGLTDSGFATLAVTPSQLSADQGLLNGLTGNFIVNEIASSANLTMTGLAGHANVAVFSGQASQYSITSANDGVNFTVTDTGTGRSSIDHLSNFTALKFSDFTDFVAQAPSSTSVTTGNIAELYGAAFGRLPDAAGLAFYQTELKTVPGLSLFALAQNFLSAPEYTNNAAHLYEQSAAGDAQFIADTYQSLLHRAPESAAIPFYQAIIAQYTNGLSAGSAAYATAELQGHALVLVDISASTEFLNNVQITAAHPADSQHWLYLI